MICRVFVAGIVLGSAIDAPAAKGLAALRPRLDPSTLPKVPSVCVDGRSGWREVEGAGRARLVAAFEAFPWKERRFRAPAECELTVDVLCAPDLDGDERRDFVVRARWRQPAGGVCDASGVRHEAVLVATRVSAWTLVDVISYTAADASGLAEARVAFVQLPDSTIGLTCKTQTEKRGGGCRVLGYWVGKVAGGRVERLGEADPEFCLPD